MAVTIYSQRKLLARHWLPVLVGCVVGVVTAMGSILVLCRLLGLDRAMTMSLLPKSVTMPIATVVAQGHGGTVAPLPWRRWWSPVCWGTCAPRCW